MPASRFRVPVVSLGADGDSPGVAVRGAVPAASLYSAGIVGWRIYTGTMEGPLLYYPNPEPNPKRATILILTFGSE